MLDGALAFWHAYALEVDWEALDLLEKRVCELVPALMLARIDGKSPVEYLNKKNQALIRSIAIDTILNCPQKLTDFTEALSLRLEKSI